MVVVHIYSVHYTVLLTKCLTISLSDPFHNTVSFSILLFTYFRIQLYFINGFVSLKSVCLKIRRPSCQNLFPKYYLTYFTNF